MMVYLPVTVSALGSIHWKLVETCVQLIGRLKNSVPWSPERPRRVDRNCACGPKRVCNCVFLRSKPGWYNIGWYIVYCKHDVWLNLCKLPAAHTQKTLSQVEHVHDAFRTEERDSQTNTVNRRSSNKSRGYPEVDREQNSLVMHVSTYNSSWAFPQSRQTLSGSDGPSMANIGKQHLANDHR